MLFSFLFCFFNLQFFWILVYWKFLFQSCICFKIVIFLPWCRDLVLRAHFLSCSAHLPSFSCILTWRADDIGLSGPNKNRSSSFLSFWCILDLNVVFTSPVGFPFIVLSIPFIFLSWCFHILFWLFICNFWNVGVFETLFKRFIENRFKIVIFLPWCRDLVLRAHFLSCSAHLPSFSCILTWRADDIGLSGPNKNRSSSFLSFWCILELNVVFYFSCWISFHCPVNSFSFSFPVAFISFFGYSFAIFGMLVY